MIQSLSLRKKCVKVQKMITLSIKNGDSQIYEEVLESSDQEFEFPYSECESNSLPKKGWQNFQNDYGVSFSNSSQAPQCDSIGDLPKHNAYF